MSFGANFAFWIYMLIVVSLCPLTMIIFGKRFKEKPPESINSAFGYRTERSMKNKETWDFAHIYVGTLWMKCGIALFPVSVILMMFSMHREISYIGYYSLGIVLVQMAIMLITIFVTENKLKQAFDEYGIRR